MQTKYFYYGAGTLALAAILVFWVRSTKPLPGELYRRAAHDSSMVTRVILSDSASSPLARRLVTDLLMRELLVRIDRIDRCKAVMEYYDAVNRRLQASTDLLEQAFLAARPVQLYSDDEARCFAYSITYRIPLPEPMTYRQQVLTKVPLQLTIIHPMRDIKYFKRERHD